MTNLNITSGVEENVIRGLSRAASSAGITGAEPSNSPTLPSSYDEGTAIGEQTQGISERELQETKTSLEAPKKTLKGVLDKALLKRAESIIDGFNFDDPLSVTVNMESLQGVVLELWESATTSSQYHQDILAALESAILSIEVPSEDQLSVFREAIRDLGNEVLTVEHVDIIRQQFIANGFSPLALLDEVEDGDSNDRSQD